MKKPLSLSNTALLLISIVFSFSCLELFGRFYVGAWPFRTGERAELTYLTEKDKSLLWRFEPGVNGRNSLGLRNREIGEKTDSQYRILFLGDSLIWSGDTSKGHLYTEEIEIRLNQSADSTRYEVINAGIPGYTTYQELEFLKIYGLDMKPDLVILGFVFNDVFFKYLHQPQKDKLLGNEPSSNLNRFSKESFLGKIFANSYAAHGVVYASDVISTRLSGRQLFPFENRGDFYLAWKEFGWSNSERLLDEMHRLLKSKDVPLVVLAFPVSDQVNEKILELDREYVLFPQTQLRRICERYGIPFVDLTEVIGSNGGLELYRDYLHLNPQGNDVVAEELSAYLSSLLLVK